MLFIFSCCSGSAIATRLLADPFAEPSIMSCSEQSDYLQQQLLSWHFRGIVHASKRDNMVYQQIWLVNDNQHWLSIILPTIPLELAPWLIQNMTAKVITWQAQLPEYCPSPLLINMPLEGG